MIRKEGTYVRVMTIAPARQLTLDIPWPDVGVQVHVQSWVRMDVQM